MRIVGLKIKKCAIQMIANEIRTVASFIGISLGKLYNIIIVRTGNEPRYWVVYFTSVHCPENYGSTPWREILNIFSWKWKSQTNTLLKYLHDGKMIRRIGGEK